MTWLQVSVIVTGLALIVAGLSLIIKRLVAGDTTIKVLEFQITAPVSFGVVFAGVVLIVVGAVFVPPNDSHDSMPTIANTSTAFSSPITATTTTTSTPSPTAVTDPLKAVFRQVGSGRPFNFASEGGVVQDTLAAEADCHRPERPVGLRLNWNMTGNGKPFGGWGVQWDQANPAFIDASAFTRLVVSVKGANGNEIFQVGVKDHAGNEAKIESKERLLVAQSWGQLSLLLRDFTAVDKSKIANINIGFNRNHGAGQICIDEISFQ
jgi:hypothetical protein